MACSAMPAPSSAPRLLMRRPTAWRAGVALLAAYVLFMQMLALAIAGASHAAALADPLALSICSSTGEAGGHGPADRGDDHHAGCLVLCAAACHGTVAGALRDAPSLPAPVRIAASVEHRTETAPLVRSVTPRPWPRGPPLKG